MQCHVIQSLPAACWPSRQTVFVPRGCWGPQSNLLYQSEPRWTSGCGKRLHHRNKDSASIKYLRDEEGKMQRIFSKVILICFNFKLHCPALALCVHTHCWSGAMLSGWPAWRWARASPDLSSPLCRPLLPPPGWSHSRDPTPAPAVACSFSLGSTGGDTQEQGMDVSVKSVKITGQRWW